MQQTFSTPHPVSLFVELRTGDLVVRTDDVTETLVEVSGPDADAVAVEHRGDEISVVAPRRPGGFFRGDEPLSVHVRAPHDSRLSTKLGSVDVRVEGRLGQSSIHTGTGDVRVDRLGAEAWVESGSGNVRVDVVDGALRVKCGSGAVVLDRISASAEVSTGSGDVLVSSVSESLAVRSGSGDLRVGEACEDVLLSTASGDVVVDLMRRGRLTAKNVSGDITVGVPPGIPIWTDVSSLTGSVRSDLQGAGRPEEGQQYLELRAATVSGDVRLEQL
jgi:DUF4097 and DUF4098 domain-containing protein YvlB